MNKQLGIVGGVIILIILFFILGGREHEDHDHTEVLSYLDNEAHSIETPRSDVIVETGLLYAYQINGDYIDGASVVLDFVSDGGYPVLNVAMDLNGDEMYSANEWKLQNVQAYVKESMASSYEIELAELTNLDSPFVNAIATFSSDAIDGDWLSSEEIPHQHVRLDIAQEDLTTILGVNEPGYEPGLYRGFGNITFGPKVAHAQADITAPEFNIDLSYDIGDLPQGVMECGPTSVTNNLRGLAAANGRGDDLPDPQTMINQLKQDFSFGARGKQGVLDENYIAGKNAFMNRYNLPIVTTEITNPGYEDFKKALDDGAVIEMDLAGFQMVDGKLTQVASHLVAVTGLSSDGEGGFRLRGRDSATNDPEKPAEENWNFIPKGGKIAQSQLVYPKNAGGATIVNKIYIQKWVTVDEAIAAGVLPAGAVGSTLPVVMLVIDGNYYPKDQFKQAGPDRCKGNHFHKQTEAVGLKNKTDTDLAFKKDPATDGCGFGQVGKVKEETVNITWAQQQSLAAGLTTP